MTEQLRYGPSYQVVQLQEHIDFTPDQGFHRAVEMCNGAGICRKRTTGTMCPSFMVTREEEHTTRGRANALRNALSGRLPHEELTSERMYEVMDLCIECKACKSECPSSVDMAKIKFQFLAMYHEKNGTPFRTRFFGQIPWLTRMTSGPLAAIANTMMRTAPMKQLLDATLGISRHRTLPSFATRPFTAWFKRRIKAPTSKKAITGKKQVILFHDTFNTYNSPGRRDCGYRGPGGGRLRSVCCPTMGAAAGP